MRKGGGKQKGSAFERLICKELSLWISRGEAQDVFWRSAMSGGRSTVAMKQGTKLAAQAGDVSSIDTLGHKFIQQFMVECKFYKSLDYAALIKGKGNLLTFWNRAYEDAREYHKQPILIAKQNNYPIVACMTRATIDFFDAQTYVIMSLPNEDMEIILWEDFKKLNPNPKAMRRRVRL